MLLRERKIARNKHGARGQGKLFVRLPLEPGSKPFLAPVVHSATFPLLVECTHSYYKEAFPTNAPMGTMKAGDHTEPTPVGRSPVRGGPLKAAVRILLTSTVESSATISCINLRRTNLAASGPRDCVWNSGIRPTIRDNYSRPGFVAGPIVSKTCQQFHGLAFKGFRLPASDRLFTAKYEATYSGIAKKTALLDVFNILTGHSACRKMAERAIVAIAPSAQHWNFNVEIPCIRDAKFAHHLFRSCRRVTSGFCSITRLLKTRGLWKSQSSARLHLADTASHSSRDIFSAMHGLEL